MPLDFKLREDLDLAYADILTCAEALSASRHIKEAMHPRLDLSPRENDQRAALLGIAKNIIDGRVLSLLTQVINHSVEESSGKFT